MSVFHGDWNEDPKGFLDSFLRCTATGDDKFKARQFINYLGASSDADDWFDELPQDKKKDWMAIEVSFRKRWFKDEPEVLSIKETVTGTTENEPQLEPTLISSNLATATPLAFTATTTSPNNTTTSQHLNMGPPNHPIMLQSPANFRNSKNPKFHPTSENSSNITVFSSPMPSHIVSNSPTAFPTITAHETRPTMTDFTEKVEKVENPSIYSPKTPLTSFPLIPEDADDVSQVHTSLPTHNNIVLPPSTLPTTATSHTSASTGYGKSELLCGIFESQLPAESLASTTIVMALKTRSVSAVFMKNQQNFENPPFSTQKPSEPLVSGGFNFSDNTDSYPASTTIDSDNERCSASTNYTETIQKVENQLIFTQKATEPIISGCYKCTNTVDSFLEPTTISTASKTRSASTSFVKNYRKLEKSIIFAKKDPEPLILGRFKWANDSESLETPFILPTKHPCNLSDLLSNKFISSVLVLSILHTLQVVIISFCYFLIQDFRFKFFFYYLMGY